MAFNPPGTEAAARTRVVALPESTRRDNLATFPTFGGELDAVPRHGVTVGVATIRERSAEVVMIGARRGQDRGGPAGCLTATAYDPDWPATVWVECRQPAPLPRPRRRLFDHDPRSPPTDPQKGPIHGFASRSPTSAAAPPAPPARWPRFLAHGKEFDGSHVVLIDQRQDRLDLVETIATQAGRVLRASTSRWRPPRISGPA